MPYESLPITVTIWLAMMLLWISVWDINHMRIPNIANGLLVISGLIVSAIYASGWPVQHLFGVVSGYLVFAVVGEIYFRWTGTDGLGLGDAKLLAGAGAWLGWAALPGLVALAAVSALCYALILKRQKLAFGPWLSASFLLNWVHQAHI
ncbi:prepilin peptidase [Roseobacter sp. EG26]|uniref:prepilin peptidase n=1 Tax=Roseobacter sp. EG26 TaxID=3412477 RepID=UPI003CE5249A